jgi:hypothetical protein
MVCEETMIAATEVRHFETRILNNSIMEVLLLWKNTSSIFKLGIAINLLCWTDFKVFMSKIMKENIFRNYLLEIAINYSNIFNFS